MRERTTAEKALMFHASNMQREEMRGAVNGETAFDFCYRCMYQKDLPNTDSPSMGAQDLANFILWLIEDNQLPNDLVSPIQEGAQEELAARHKTLQTDKDQEEMWVRWICLLYTSPSPRDVEESRMPSSA